MIIPRCKFSLLALAGGCGVVLMLTALLIALEPTVDPLNPLAPIGPLVTQQMPIDPPPDLAMMVPLQREANAALKTLEAADASHR